MKNLKSILIPAAILVFGVGSAFATNKAKTEASTTITAYHFDEANEQCILVGEVNCNTVSGPVCTEWVNGVQKPMQLFVSPTECGQVLYRN